MRLRTLLSCRALLLALAALAFGLAVPPCAAAQTAGILHRGIALFHPLYSADTTPGPDKQFLFPPFAAARHTLTDKQLSIIRKAGFDFVRLPVDPGPFLQFTGARRDALDDQLGRTVQRILDSGLAVIVDFHPNAYGPADYLPPALVKGADTPMFESYCTMLTRTARLLDGLHSERVAFELMNEPAVGGTFAGDAQWQTMEEMAYARIRAVSPKLTLVLTGGRNGGFDGLTALDPGRFSKDNAVLYTFHYYRPLEFTYQSYSPDPKYRLAADIPYPAQARPMSDSVNAITVRVMKLDSSLAQRATDMAKGFADLVRYKAENFGRSDIHRDFDQVASWAKTNNIPPNCIFLGEFGVIRRHDIYDGARDSERIRWLSDVRQEAEARGFFWSLWAYSGTGGMEVIKNDHADEIDLLTLSALGIEK